MRAILLLIAVLISYGSLYPFHFAANHNWLREAAGLFTMPTLRMGRGDLIGPGKSQLIPLHQPATDSYQSARRKNSTPAGSHKVAKDTTKSKPMLTQHTGLPPRAGVAAKAAKGKPAFKAAAKPAGGAGKPGTGSRKPR